MSAGESTAGMEEPTHHRRGDRVRRVGDDVEGPPRQPQIRSIGTNDSDAICEAGLELVGTSRMQFDRDDTSASVDQRARDGAPSGSDVEHEGVLGEPSVTNESACNRGMELVPPPPWRPGHGDAPS